MARQDMTTGEALEMARECLWRAQDLLDDMTELGIDDYAGELEDIISLLNGKVDELEEEAGRQYAELIRDLNRDFERGLL